MIGDFEHDLAGQESDVIAAWLSRQRVDSCQASVRGSTDTAGRNRT
jgi:hypothetical protein